MSPPDAVLEHLPKEIRPYVERLLDESPATLARLRREVDGYVEYLAGRGGPTADRAHDLARRCRVLLDEAAASGRADLARIVQIGVRYFVSDQDAEDDLASPEGLDDDAHVLDAVEAVVRANA